MTNVVNLTRRSFMRGALKQQHLPRLPWAIEESAFLAGCSQCNACINACEQQIIKRDSQGYPFVDFDQDECTFCRKCVDACSKPIFKTEQTDLPWPGDFEIDNKCLAKNQIYCQSCKDVCDSKAITFSYQTSSIPEPKLNLSDCNQCGACVSICPQDAISFQLEIISNEHN